MKRIGTLVVTAAIAAASGVSVAQASPADDQASVDAAIAAFNERMTEAGGIASPAPDLTPIDPADPADTELVQDNPINACFGGIGPQLEPGGRFEGETARAFSADFAFTAPDASVTTDMMELAMADVDDVSAGVITVGDGQEGPLDELVELAGSDEFEACLLQAYETLSASVAEGMPPSTDPSATAPTTEFDVSAESDIGVGDASARMVFSVTSSFGGETYATVSTTSIARVDRSLVFVSMSSSTPEPVSGVDVDAELAELVDAL